MFLPPDPTPFCGKPPAGFGRTLTRHVLESAPRYEVQHLQLDCFEKVVVAGRMWADLLSTPLRKAAADCMRRAAELENASWGLGTYVSRREIKRLRLQASCLREEAQGMDEPVTKHFVAEWLDGLESVLYRAAEKVGLDISVEKEWERKRLVFRIMGWEYQVPKEDVDRREMIYEEASRLARAWTKKENAVPLSTPK